MAASLSAAPDMRGAGPGHGSPIDPKPWLIAVAGLLALYGPTYWVAWNGIWQTDDMGHGPIILAVLAWLFWGVRKGIADAPNAPRPSVGWPLFGVGLVLYLFGRVFNISSIEFGSHLFVVSGLLLC